MEDPKNEEKEINQEEKPIDTLKDEIKKENISDINIKNQSNENEEIKILIDNNKIKEEGKNNNKNKKEEIIKKANKIPEIEPSYEYQINDTMKKIKNKSLEKKMKDIFNSDKKNVKENGIINKENKFIDKLKEIEVKIEKIGELKRKKQNEFEFTLKNNKEEKNNRYETYNNEKGNEKENNINKKKNFDFNFNITNKNGLKENKYKDLNKWYFSVDKFEFYNSPSDWDKKKYKLMNYNEEMKKFSRKYNAQRFRSLTNNIRRTHYPDNFKNILDKVDKFEQNRKESKFLRNNLTNNKLTQSDPFSNKYKYKSIAGNLKTISKEKPSKIKNLIEDIYLEINKTNTVSSKNKNSKKLSNIKSKVKYSHLSNYKNNLNIIKTNNMIDKNRFTKSSFSNLDELLKLCSKRNLKKYAYNINN
jgi:hypothetical protein